MQVLLYYQSLFLRWMPPYLYWTVVLDANTAQKSGISYDTLQLAVTVVSSFAM
jgi:hypothetical protein